MLKKLTFLSFFLCALAGCGFSLRGQLAIPGWLNRIAIVTENANPMVASFVKSQFESYGLQVLATTTKADYVLVIEKDSLLQQITSVSASTTPRQYQLTYSVRYYVNKVKNQPFIPMQTVVIQRQFTVNNDRILGSDFEGLTIVKEMRRDAARQIINRISRQQ